MKLLETQKRMNIADMQKKLFLSQSTLRRDLIYLEKQNLIKREFGHVFLLSESNIEFPYFYREQKNEEAKKYICAKAAEFIEDNFAAFIDSSSTASYIPDFLSKRQNLTMITNGLKVASKINSMPNSRLFLLGGNIPTYVGSTVGTEALKQIEHYRANIAVMSFGGIDGSHIFITDQDQANLRSAMVENSEKSILLMDSTKFGKSDFIKFGPMDMFDVLITEKKPDQKVLTYAETHDLQIVF